MKKLTYILINTFFVLNAYSAYLRNVPVDLKQPDGSVIHCLITGDEFHRRVHDADNYTIIADPVTGYYVYALLEGSSIKPSDFIVGRVDPKKLDIEPGYDQTTIINETQKQTYLKSGGELPSKSIQEGFDNNTNLKSGEVLLPILTKGDLNNILISVRFSDQSPTTLSLQDYEKQFNSLTDASLKYYFKEVSNSQLNVSTYYFPSPQGQTILEYQDTQPRAYYTPYNNVNNPIGYTSDNRFDREFNLVKNAINFVNQQIIDSHINFDINNDGFIDNVIFVFQGNMDAYGNILWPMKSAFMSNVIAGDKLLSVFNKQFSSALTPGILSHELFHSMGAPDLYRSNNSPFNPVGTWDIMATSAGQHMTTYLKWKYAKWFDNLPEITQPGTYTLKPVSQSPFACYKIPSPVSSTEYFIVEYRKKEGLLESKINYYYDDGLIVYRINTEKEQGNIGGPPDEVYIFRPGGTTTVDGDLSKAALSANSGRIALNDNTNPSCFLSVGTKGWIDISNVTGAGNQISFTLNSVAPLYRPQNLSASDLSNQILLKWNTPIKKINSFLGFNIYLGNSNIALNTTLLTDTSFLTSVPGQNPSYTYKVTAMYQNGESEPISCRYFGANSPEKKDSLALVTLFNQCNGPNWTKKDNWLTGPMNKWSGVKVYNYRVVELELGLSGTSVGLTGTIPAELSNLTELSYIGLYNSNLTGNLPESWSTLTKLQRIFLYNNKLSGTLPESWSSLTNLYWLDLSRNQLTGTLPESWSSLVNLIYLYLHQNNFSGTLPTSWSSFVNLKQLYLSYNSLTGTLPGSWSVMLNLEKMDLSVNQLSGNLPQNWSGLVNLKNLGLGWNILSGTLPDSWSTFSKLEYLSLSVNQLTGTIPESWSSLSKLKYCYLSYGNLSGTLPTSWSSNQNLINLSLNDNRFNHLPDLSSLTNLSSLQVQNNLFDFGDIEPNIGFLNKTFIYSPQGKFGQPEIYIKNQGEALTLTANASGTSNLYQWYKNGSLLSGKTSDILTFNSLSSYDSGSYICKVTNTKVPNLILESEPLQVQVNLTTSQFSLIESPSSKFYPNPTTGILTVEFTQNPNNKYEVSVTDMTGSEIYRKEVCEERKLIIDLSHQVSGIYILRIVCDKQHFISKLILQKQ